MIERWNIIMLLLLPQLLVLMLSLIVIGEPIRVLFLKRLTLFADLDIPQICILDVYLGGIVLYVLAMLPFQLFSKTPVLGLVSAFSVVRKEALLDYSLLFFMFLIFLCIQLVPLTNFVFGSIHDTSLHSLMVQVILETNNVPVTLQPYTPEGIIYPQASHVIFAYASHILDYEAPKSLFYVTPLFNALSVFGAYFLGKKLWDKRSFYLGLSFVFAFVSSWPLYITWGANPFVTGFPLFFICLGLLFSIFQTCGKNHINDLMMIGLLFGYCAALIISYLETLLIISFSWLIYSYIKKLEPLMAMSKEFFLIAIVSFCPLSPFIYRFIAFYQHPGHNIGIASGFIGYEKFQTTLTQALEWIIVNLTPHVFLTVEFIALLVGSIVLLWKLKVGDKNLKRLLLFTAMLFLSSALLSFVSYFLPADVSFISWPHQSIMFSIPISVFFVVFFMKLTQFLNTLNLQKLARIFSTRSVAGFFMSITILAAISAPFVYYRLMMDPSLLVGSYGVFAITTYDDYELMHWMKENLPKSAAVLVNPFGSGLFIPSTSNHKIIFPNVASQRAFDYQKLVSLLEQNTLNLTAFELMQDYNITHIFVNPHATYWWSANHAWEPELFLGNPNFQLAKKVGESYLFECSYYDPKVVLSDEFDHMNFMDSGWLIEKRGVGAGNAEVVSTYGDYLLMLNATRLMKGMDYFYELQITREVYLADVSNVTMSFYLNATSGFDQFDTVAIILSNSWSNMSICFATPDGIFQILDPNQTRTFTLDGFAGRFEFNISEAWRQVYNENLPGALVLRIKTLDANGTPNVVLFDSLKILT